MRVFLQRTIFLYLIIYCLLLIAPNCFVSANEKDDANSSSAASSISWANVDWKNLWNSVPDERPWSVLFYSGETAIQSVNHLLSGQYNSAHEVVYSGELAYTIYKTFWSKLQLAGNIALRDADKEHYPSTHLVTEFDPYLMFRFTEFPWNNYIVTTLGIGEGISFASRTPYPEETGVTSNSSQPILDFMAFELTFAAPSNPALQLALRIHHRSGAYGVFRPLSDHAGSNTIGIGIRYDF